LQALVEQSRIIRLPLNKVGAYNKINRAMSEFEQEFQREPTHDELEEILQITSREIGDLVKSATRHVSMDAPFNEDGEGSLYDVLIDDNAGETEKEMMKESLKKEIKKVMSILPARDSEIISYYFGLKGEGYMTLEEIGGMFNLTRERVRQIKERALRRLRKTTNSRSLKSYLGQ
jgi:RNA polymerase primary sigma factor